MIMTFGKHKGTPLHNIPEDYLSWVLDNCSNLQPTLRRAIEQTLDLHDDRRQAGSTRAIETNVVGNWYRQLAREFHPDVRGSHEGMVAINRAKDLLLETITTM